MQYIRLYGGECSPENWPNDVILESGKTSNYPTTQFYIFYNTNSATCDVINYELNQAAESLVIDKEQCHTGQVRDGNMRPTKGVREKERITGIVGQDMRYTLK